MVCVTGASGYIASWLVKFLLQRGYTVKASVRDPSPYRSTFLCFFGGFLWFMLLGYVFNFWIFRVLFSPIFFFDQRVLFSPWFVVSLIITV